MKCTLTIPEAHSKLLSHQTPLEITSQQRELLALSNDIIKLQKIRFVSIG